MNGIKGVQQKEMLIFLNLLNTHIKVNINSDTMKKKTISNAYLIPPPHSNGQ